MYAYYYQPAREGQADGQAGRADACGLAGTRSLVALCQGRRADLLPLLPRHRQLRVPRRGGQQGGAPPRRQHRVVRQVDVELAGEREGGREEQGDERVAGGQAGGGMATRRAGAALGAGLTRAAARTGDNT